MRESRFQSNLIKKLRKLFPGCVILKLDSSYMQGIPDLLVLYRNKWAVLEVKKSLREPCQPNQQYYVEQLGAMSFAAFVCPETEQEILGDLQRTFSLAG